MFKLVPDRAPRKLAPGRVHIVTLSSRAMENVPSDREAKLLEILNSFLEIDLNRLQPPEIWKLRVIQGYARKHLEGYTR